MDWSKGYSASYHMTIVDPITWRDIGRVEITGGSISRGLDGLRESASIDCEVFNLGIEQWVRVWLNTKQAGSSESLPIFTGLASSPNNDKEGNIQSYHLECYSVLKAADDIKLSRGWYAPAGVKTGDILRELFSPVPSEVIIPEDTPYLTFNIIAEDNESNLTMADKILSAMGDWDIRIEGDGTVYVTPNSTDPVVIFDALEFDVIETSLSINEDWFSCPNVLMVINNDMMSVAKDESEYSPASIPNRGREVWVTETNPELGAEETIEEYTSRRLKELQRVFQVVSYTRRYVPNVVPGDYIMLKYPDQGLDDIFFVESQGIDLAYSASTSETVDTVVGGE